MSESYGQASRVVHRISQLLHAEGRPKPYFIYHLIQELNAFKQSLQSGNWDQKKGKIHDMLTHTLAKLKARCEYLEALLILKEGEGLDEKVFSVPLLFEEAQPSQPQRENEYGDANGFTDKYQNLLGVLESEHPEVTQWFARDFAKLLHDSGVSNERNAIASANTCYAHLKRTFTLIPNWKNIELVIYQQYLTFILATH